MRWGQLFVFWILFASLAITGAHAQQTDDVSSSEAYELPEVIVDAPKQAAPKKRPKPQSSSGASEPASGQSSTSGEPEPIAADAAGATAGEAPAAGFSDGGGAAVGNAPAVSSAGFTSGRIVEQVGTVEEVTAEQIERVGARTLDEALRLMPGVHVRNGGDGVPRIDIRGMRTRNITILVDGVPQNGTFDGQFDPRAIPVENIARIKVTRGGSSVLYGPGGNAAVIDIITKAAGPGLRATADTMVGFGQQKDARVTASYGGDAVSTFISASIYQQDQFHLSDDFAFTTLQPNDARVNSDREDRAIYGNTQIKVTEDIQWGFSINYREGEYGKPPSTVNSAGGQGCRNSGTDPSAPFNWGPCSDFASGLRFERVDDYTALSLQTSGLIDLGSGLTLRPMAYFNNNNELTNRFDDKDYATQLLNNSFREDAETSIYGGGGQIAFRPDDSNLITIALDAHRESWDATGFSRSGLTLTVQAGPTTCNSANSCRTVLANRCSGPNGLGGNFSNNSYTFTTVAGVSTGRGTCNNVRSAVNRNEDLDVFSAAAEYEVKLTSQLSAVVGAGWAEQHRETTSDGDYTYLAGLRYAFTEDTVLRGNVARKIRFPTLRNLYDADGGNENLETEVTQNYEVGLDQRLPFINGLFSVTVFRIDAQDFIRRANIGCNGIDEDENPFCNFEQLRFQGVETILAFSPFAGFNTQIGYTYLDASNEAPGFFDPVTGDPGNVPGTSTLDNEPEHKVMAAVSYAIGGGATLLADYQYVADSFAVARNQIDTLELADFHLLNLGVTQDVGGAYQLYGRVENVLDENYESSFGFPEAGRVFFIGLRAKLGPG